MRVRPSLSSETAVCADLDPPQTSPPLDSDIVTATPIATHGSRGNAPLLSRTSGRTGQTTTSGGSKAAQPWYLRTAYIVLLIAILLVALALGVGLGVGLTKKDSEVLSGSSGGSGSGGNVTSTAEATTISTEVTVGGGVTVVPSTAVVSGVDATSVVVETVGGSTITQTLGGTGAAATTVNVQVSETVNASESFFLERGDSLRRREEEGADYFSRRHHLLHCGPHHRHRYADYHLYWIGSDSYDHADCHADAVLHHHDTAGCEGEASSQEDRRCVLLLSPDQDQSEFTLWSAGLAME